MSGTTTRLGLKTPADPDPFLTIDFVNNLQTIESYPGVFVCTSTTKPSWAAAQAGQLIYCTDTRNLLAWSGSAWFDPLVAPSAWNLSAGISSSISSGASGSWSLGSFSSTRAGTALVLSTVFVGPVADIYEVIASTSVSINGNGAGQGSWAQYGLYYSASFATAAPGQGFGITSMGFCPVNAGSNSASVGFTQTSSAAPGYTPGGTSMFVYSARMVALMVDSTAT